MTLMINGYDYSFNYQQDLSEENILVIEYFDIIMIPYFQIININDVRNPYNPHNQNSNKI